MKAGCFYFVWSLVTLAALVVPASADEGEFSQVRLRAWGVPEPGSMGIASKARRRILQAYQDRFPHVMPVPTTGLSIMGNMHAADITALMQIAGDIAPHVMFVNFRQSDTYIRNKFLYPLDRYIEQAANGNKNCIYIPDSHLMPLDAYLDQLRQLPHYQRELGDRVPRQCWDVMRRECPYGVDCPHCREWGIEPRQRHYHIWCFPEGPKVTAMAYRQDLFAEAGLPDRVPADWDELLAWSRELTNPAEERYGLYMDVRYLGWATTTFLYSLGGRIVDTDEEGNWRCVFDSDEAVEAYYFVARLFLEPFTNKWGTFDSVVYTGDPRTRQVKNIGMYFVYFDEQFFLDVAGHNFGPVPVGPTGFRASEFNSEMTGIFAGLADDSAIRDLAWEYIRFFDGSEARRIRTDVFVEEGLGQFIQPRHLRAAGYDEYVRMVPAGWEEAFTLAQKTGVPEPYGRNCQLVYQYVSKAVDQIRTDAGVREAIRAGDAQVAKEIIRQILQERVKSSNEKMLNIFTPKEKNRRAKVAAATVLAIIVIFVLVCWRVSRVFADQAETIPGSKRGAWEFGRYKWAYILMIPAVGSIFLWEYYPLVRGMIMAFQDYNVRGFSEWIGMENFAFVLYDPEFWFSLWVTFKYAFLFMLFGFCTPIVLAILLTEVPRGKILFRTIYYLPAVLTGVVTLLLWKGFYGEYGMINQVMNFFIEIVNWVLPAAYELDPVRTRWLDSPGSALFFCLLPIIWAGLGPGCLIYLAALKTIPEDLYEAADIDGATIWHKVFHIAVPGIKGLILINFIGTMVGLMKSSGANMLAMTGGGPFNPYGQTEVTGLRIFWEAFGYLRFGTAVSMAWILGSLLIGFTVMQMTKLSKMEFKTAKGV